MNNLRSGHFFFPIKQSAKRIFGKPAIIIWLKDIKILSQKSWNYLTITNHTNGITK